LTEPLPDWVAHPDWIRAEGIRGFVGQPLIHRGQVLGVLAVFARGAIERRARLAADDHRLRRCGWSMDHTRVEDWTAVLTFEVGELMKPSNRN
jgi:hypothetical protein